MKKILIISYSYTGHTHQIARAIRTLTGGDWCEIYPLAAVPHGFSGAARSGQKGGADRVSAPSASGLCQSERVRGDFCRFPQLVRKPSAAAGFLAGSKRSVRQNHSAFLFHCGGVSCDFSRDMARLCPKAEVRQALGVMDDDGAVLLRILRDWLNQNDLQPLPAGYAG